LHRQTVKKWLKEPIPINEITVLTEKPDGLDEKQTEQTNSGGNLKPPDPWTDWEEVRVVREALQEHRFLFVRQPKHLSQDDQKYVADLLESPIGEKLETSYAFMKDWYSFWKGNNDQRLSLAEAQARYQTWRVCEAYNQVKPLQRVIERFTPERFDQVSFFLRNDKWEATNNGAERTGRDFRHHQAPHFNLRSEASIQGSLTINAVLRMNKSLLPPSGISNLPTRGRVPMKGDCRA
jgi:hypothetical protein